MSLGRPAWDRARHWGASNNLQEVITVSIIRIGLAETKKFAEGYEAIFGPKKKKDDVGSESKGKKQDDKKAAKVGKKKSKR